MAKLRSHSGMVIVFLCFTMLFCGCGVISKEEFRSLIDDAPKVEDAAQGSSSLENTENESSDTSDHAIDSSQIGHHVTEITKEAAQMESTDYLVPNYYGHFAYDQLDEEEQKLYDSILRILLLHKTEVTVPSLDVDQIDFAFECVMMDHPELFYVSGYSYSKYTVNGVLSSIDFSGTYTVDEEEVREKQLFLETEISSIIGGIPYYESDYDLAKYFYETIILNTNYVLNAQDNQNICSVFLTHESVCQGYAKALQLLFLDVGIESVIVTGTVSEGEGHAWVLAKLDGEYYHIDPTWGDASYNAVGAEMITDLPDINYDYLCVTSEEISRCHNIGSRISIPWCSSLTDNYYVKEGLYFTSVDESMLHEVFERAYGKQEAFLTIKCSGEAVYQEMLNYLLDQNDPHVFQYLASSVKQVKFSSNEEQCTVSIWLE